MKNVLAAALSLAFVVTAAPTAAQDEASNAIQFGNGERNWISVEGMERADSSAPYSEVRISNGEPQIRRGDGLTLTFQEVHVEGDSWLVMHPFVGGKPSGTHVAGYSFVEQGTNLDVQITLNPAPAAGEAFIVMLHKDADQDRVFDFVFVAENVVEDVAVFEGSTMIAHVVTIPE